MPFFLYILMYIMVTTNNFDVVEIRYVDTESVIEKQIAQCYILRHLINSNDVQIAIGR